MPERNLLKCRTEVSSSQANLINLDVSLMASLLASTSFPKQTEPSNAGAADFNDVITGLKKELLEARTVAKIQNLELINMKQKYDDAVNTVEKLRQKENLASASSIDQGLEKISEFSKFEIEKATENFNDELEIGKGGFGSVYKCQLRNTVVAIKKLDPLSLQGEKEFLHEVDVLHRVRHPNIVTLIGSCSDSCALIYEFLPNGSLADRLKCKNNTSPLTWQTRTRIAFEICTALIFMHSNSPPIVHGDLKPENILLDANLVSKLGDFGLCRLLQQSSSSGTTDIHISDKLKGSPPYMDPELLTTGEITKYCDVYSFGIVILQLITGMSPRDIVWKVKEAEKQFHVMIDKDAGPWPYVQARKLANLGLKCCELSRRNRPDLAGEVWSVLKSMLPASSELAMDDSVLVPKYFICPITMDIMEDPHIATDGFTYEATAIKHWFDTEHNTSPVTNETLPNCELIRNHALRSDIKEWLQKFKHS